MKFNDFRLFIYQEFGDRQFSAADANRVTGASKPSVYRWLKKMVDEGELTHGDRLYGFPVEIPAPEVHKPVEVEVIEERMPSAAMTVEKFTAKDGHIVPKPGLMESGDTSNALSLSPKELKKEARLERNWEKLLTQPNKSQDFKTQYSSKISSNWAQVVKLHSIEDATFLRLKELTKLLVEQCGKQKWFKQIPSDEQLGFESDCEAFVADALWDVKRQSGKFCNPRYHEKAYARHVMREARGSCHESIGHGTKKVKEAAQKVSDLADTLKAKADSYSVDELKESVEKLSDLVESLSLLILSGIEEIKTILTKNSLKPIRHRGCKESRQANFYNSRRPNK